MNKQELIEKYKELANSSFDIAAIVVCQLVLKDLEQLDEPQKVKVSEEEAKFLETFDFNCESDVITALYHVSRVGYGYYLTDNNDIELKDLSEEFRELENRKRLIKAILDGYEVEKEKRYVVKIKATGQCLGKYYINNEILSPRFIYTGRNADAFTRKELKEAGFGWVFDCEGVEIEEVK